MDNISFTPTLDFLLSEFEYEKSYNKGEDCEYNVGKGKIQTRNRCKICTKLSGVLDLGRSWKHEISSGRLTGRVIEIVPSIGANTTEQAELIWKLYTECDNAQRISRQCFLRRYYTGFTCDQKHYLLRDVAYIDSGSLPPLNEMLLQLLELYPNDKSKQGGLPKNFIHGNPTVTSISFIQNLPCPLKNKGKNLLQLDYAGADSIVVTSFIQKDLSKGVIQYNQENQSLTIRKDADLKSFVREYPEYSREIARYFLVRGLLSVYPKSETEKYLPLKGSKALTLKEAFEENKGESIPMTITLQSV